MPLTALSIDAASNGDICEGALFFFRAGARGAFGTAANAGPAPIALVDARLMERQGGGERLRQVGKRAASAGFAVEHEKTVRGYCMDGEAIELPHRWKAIKWGERPIHHGLLERVVGRGHSPDSLSRSCRSPATKLHPLRHDRAGAFDRGDETAAPSPKTLIREMKALRF